MFHARDGRTPVLSIVHRQFFPILIQPPEKEERDAKGPTRIVWKAPQVVIDNHCVQNNVQDSPEKYGCRTDVNYPQFFEYNGRYFITYCNRKLDILINEIDPALLDDFGLPC